MDVTERMYKEIASQGKKPAELCRFLKISSSLMVSWKDIPPSKYLVNISEFLNVTLDWLMTGEGKKNRENESPPWELKGYQKEVAQREFQNLVEEQVALINAFEKLDAEEKEEIWVLIDHKLGKKQGLSSHSQTSKNEESGSSKTA